MGNFKVGKKVEIINSEYTHFSVGDIGIIEKINNSGCPYGVRRKTDIPTLQWFREDQIKLVESKPSKKQRIETLEKEVSELKLIVHELRERKPSVFATTVGQDLEAEYAEQVKDEPSTDISVEDKQADVIEFEGQQYRKVERLAREDDVVILTKECANNGIHSYDTPYKVVLDTDKKPCINNRYEALVYESGFNRTPETVDVYELIQPVQRQTVPCSAQTNKTPNELRAEVIEKAKAFFETNSGNEFVFSVDEDKRTAFCWKLVSNGCGYNTIHGLSTCHPNDVFNEHISKAIALGRALKLDVSEFEQAVQPNEKVVGQIVGDGEVSLTLIPSNEVARLEDETARIHSMAANSYPIINDTNAIYGGVE